MTSDFTDRCRNLLSELGLGSPDAPLEARSLTGGVASDIGVVETGDQKFCVKFALAKLKVEADWFAPVHRNAAEYAWLAFAAQTAPDSAVKLYGRSDRDHGFVMEFLDGDGIYLWKTAMLEGQAPQGEAGKVGDLLGRLHAASAKAGFDATAFQNRDDFRALRIEPYLTYTAGQHPEIAPQITALTQEIERSNQVLVHGDVSPKNILFRDGDAIVLDAECATMGDASFDPTFCLNHLILKAVHLTDMRANLLGEALALWAAYKPHVSWETADGLEARICRFLPILMLARVDGKSPVEYLSEARQQVVRDIAIPLIALPKTTLTELVNSLENALKETNT